MDPVFRNINFDPYKKDEYAHSEGEEEIFLNVMKYGKKTFGNDRFGQDEQGETTDSEEEDKGEKDNLEEEDDELLARAGDKPPMNFVISGELENVMAASSCLGN